VAVWGPLGGAAGAGGGGRVGRGRPPRGDGGEGGALIARRPGPRPRGAPGVRAAAAPPPRDVLGQNYGGSGAPPNPRGFSALTWEPPSLGPTRPNDRRPWFRQEEEGSEVGAEHGRSRAHRSTTSDRGLTQPSDDRSPVCRRRQPRPIRHGQLAPVPPQRIL